MTLQSTFPPLCSSFSVTSAHQLEVEVLSMTMTVENQGPEGSEPFKNCFCCCWGGGAGGGGRSQDNIGLEILFVLMLLLLLFFFFWGGGGSLDNFGLGILFGRVLRTIFDLCRTSFQSTRVSFDVNIEHLGVRD